MTYKFPQFNVTISDPNIEVLHVTDSINTQTCSVDVLLTVDLAEFGVSLNGFTYVSNWSDEQVREWILLELEKYSVTI
jgi:hypothetical protein